MYVCNQGKAKIPVAGREQHAQFLRSIACFATSTDLFIWTVQGLTINWDWHKVVHRWVRKKNSAQ